MKLYFYRVAHSVQDWSPKWPESDRIERVQKRALRIIYPVLRYLEALLASGFIELRLRRDDLCSKTFDKIKRPESRLNYFMPITRARAHVTDHRFLNVEQNVFKRAFPQPCISKFTSLCEIHLIFLYSLFKLCNYLYLNKHVRSSPIFLTFKLFSTFCNCIFSNFYSIM